MSLSSNARSAFSKLVMLVMAGAFISGRVSPNLSSGLMSRVSGAEPQFLAHIADGDAGDAPAECQKEAAQRDASRLAEPREKRANEVQPPALLMDILGIRPGMAVGEVGAGRGRVTVHLAARVGDKGRVYANDIDSAAVEYLKQRCRRQGLANVEALLSLPDDARFPQDTLDLIVMTYVYHHVDDPVPLLKSLLPGLKPWGFVAMAEPKPEHVEARAKALTRRTVGDEARAAGFTLDSVIEDRLQEDNIFVLRPAVPDAPESRDRAKVRALWLDYLEWTKSAQGAKSPRDYAISLAAKGVPGSEVRRRLYVLRGQFTEQPEGIEMIYDPLYGKPLTGDLANDGFKTSPNAFLVEAMKGIRPGGQALDVGAGMGRNAVHLAGLGWDVTGIDLSEKGLAVMRASAEKAGLNVRTIKTSYEDFDFGRDRWDLVAMILCWAPVEDPAFLARMKASVRPGGYVVFESNIQRPSNPFPPGVHAQAPGALRELFRDFEILVYREVDDYGDWGGPPTPLVRMVARKRGGASGIHQAVLAGDLPPKLVFAFAVNPGPAELEAILLADSIRKFGGGLSGSEIWAFAPQRIERISEPTRDRLAGFGVRILPYPVDDAALNFPLAAKVFAAAEAEGQAAGRTGFLAWLDTDTIVLDEPAAFLLPAGKSLAFRPVMHVLIGSPFDKPVDDFWKLIYARCGAPESRIFPMVTPVDEVRIRPYFNAGCLVLRPEKKVLAAWRDNFQKTYLRPEFDAFYKKNRTYAVFVHQAVLAGTILSRLEPAEILELPADYNYSLSLYSQYPGPRRIRGFDGMKTVRYDQYRYLGADSDWRKTVEVGEPFRIWLDGHLKSIGSIGEFPINIKPKQLNGHEPLK